MASGRSPPHRTTRSIASSQSHQLSPNSVISTETDHRKAMIWKRKDLAFLRIGRPRVPLDKSEGSVKDRPLPRRFSTVVFAREVEDQGSGNLTLITSR